jgi:hypothetical protein
MEKKLLNNINDIIFFKNSLNKTISYTNLGNIFTKSKDEGKNWFLISPLDDDVILGSNTDIVFKFISKSKFIKYSDIS